MESLESKIKAFASSLGFSHVGIAAVEEDETVPFLQQWLSDGFHGEMKYMENASRLSPANLYDNIHSIVVVAMNYRWPYDQEERQEGMISKYAWGSDYHAVMKPGLTEIADYIQQLGGVNTRVYVDTGPVAEKYWAMKAGIGWIGKHTNVISQKGSSWLFLGVVLTDLRLKDDAAAQDHCGSCSRCITACPTAAIVAPYVLDARLCISYLTIELRGSIPRHLRGAIGNRIFGCDDCQDVCPWNRFAFVGDPQFTPRADILAATLHDYLCLTQQAFRSRFSGTNVLRAKYRGFIRNCLVAAGNARKPELRPDIEKHLVSEDAMIREHAVWALAQYGNEVVRSKLEERRQTENDPAVRAELDYWLTR